MWKGIARRRYLRALSALSRGDVDAVLGEFAPDIRFVFVGDSPLGTELHSREAVRAWFGRVRRSAMSRRPAARWRRA